jgi:hypothetical protein
VATVPVVAVNETELAAPGTVTDAGTGNAGVLLDESATVLPPAGAARSKVTVQVVDAPDIRLVGVHASDETVGSGFTMTVVVALPPSVAVTVTVCDVTTEPPVAVNVADAAADGTVTDTGTGSAAVLLDVSVTRLPPVGAA